MDPTEGQSRNLQRIQTEHLHVPRRTPEPSSQLYPAVSEAGNVNFAPNFGSITQIAYHARPDIISSLNPILDASHSRNMALSPPPPPNSQCLPGTRMGVIRDIQTWADERMLADHPHIFWIYGYAGCGKSAIAHAIALDYARKRRLAACFVFFRGSGDRSTSERFATTVASQVVSANPGTEPFIESAVRRNPHLLSTRTASLSHQFEQLVYAPINTIASQLSAPVIIVLDGADECRDRDDISTTMKLPDGEFP